jgi:hypothetical protein
MKPNHGRYERGSILHNTQEGVFIETKAEFEKSLDKILKRDWTCDYRLAVCNLREKHPRTYRIAKYFGLTDLI